ncbi:MAG: glycerol-3-phosphate 1-O-acyltransferase PlsY [Rubrobacteridae bacterium]|nr:glycerol-3-phosphate 1-O-acyltransferase PlsY [Rubrobacteridae bacterium]
MEYAIITGILLVSYLIGSIPFGLLIGKLFYKTDIRQYGSGNIGATNTYRTLGPVPGISVFIADMMKGYVPVIIAEIIMTSVDPSAKPLMMILAGVTAMTGHNYSVFLKFSGGKGMSTAGGFIGAIWPQIFIILILTWMVVIALTRYVSLASILIAIMFPVLVIIMEPLTEYIVFSVVTALVVVFRHRSNIKRLLSGTELKFGVKAKKNNDADINDSAVNESEGESAG